MIYDLPFGRGKKFGSDWNPVTNTLLGGFQVTVIERIASGFPVPLINSNNQSGSFFQNGGNGNNWNRPDRVAGCYAPTANHTKLQQVNPACFAAAPVGQLGDAAASPSSAPTSSTPTSPSSSSSPSTKTSASTSAPSSSTSSTTPSSACP